MKKNVLTVLINYNNSDDTAECIDSILAYESEVTDILVVDNSTVDAEYEFLVKKYPNIIFYRSLSNLGFAKAANFGVQYSIDHGYRYCFLLNNDTIIQKDAISSLLGYARTSTEDILALVPTITYYQTNRVWNCGGYISPLGFRRYRYANSNILNVPNTVNKINFATGCALFLNPNLFVSLGGFSDRFFFGEDDFNFFSRIIKLDSKIYHIPNSIVEHKVSATIGTIGKNSTNRLLLYYCNRIIDIKNLYGFPYFLIFFFVNILYISYLMIVKKNVLFSIRFFYHLTKLTLNNDNVDYKLYKHIMSLNI